MESFRDPMTNRVRYKLALAKLPVLKVEKTPTGFRFALDMLNGVKMIVDVPGHADVREGDLLTLYTEVLVHAQPSTEVIQ